MKKFALLLIGLLTIGSTTYVAAETTNTVRRGTVYDGSKYIFVENGIEFSVFPDGEFDFYIPQYTDGLAVSVNAGPVGISFNTGFDYDPYVQYDDYGAVVQIESTPLFYDYYGRLTQAGDVRINYRNNRIVQVGGLYLHYNNYGVYSHYTGFINIYNRHYVYSPFHSYFYRPVFNRCLVYTTPYRRYYTPVRYNYGYHRNNYRRGYANGYHNSRRDFRRPSTGRVAHNNGRRDNVDRNNARFRGATTTSRNNSRGIASRTDRNTSKDNSRGIASRTDRNASKRNSRGVATRSDRNTSKGNSRGSSSRTTKSTSRNENSRGIATRSGRNASKANSRGSSSRKTKSTSRNGNSRGVASRSTKKSSSASRPSSSNRAKSSRTQRSSAPRATQRSSSSKRSSAASRSSSSSSSSKGRSTSSRSRRG